MSKLLRLYTNSYEKSPYLTLLCTNAILMSLGDISAQTLTSFNPPTTTDLNSIENIVNGWDIARTTRFGLYGAAVGPLAGKWFSFLDSRFPLTTNTTNSNLNTSTKSTSTGPISGSNRFEELNNNNPIPEIMKHLPKGSRLERGTGATGSNLNSGNEKGGSGARSSETEQEKEKEKERVGGEENISIMALLKRVAADQLGMAPAALFLFLFSMAVLEGLDHAQTYSKISNNFLPILLVNWKIWPLLQLINFRYVPLRFRLPFGSVCGIVWTAYLSRQIEDPTSIQEVIVGS